jgi:hypothetical protein
MTIVFRPPHSRRCCGCAHTTLTRRWWLIPLYQWPARGEVTEQQPDAVIAFGPKIALTLDARAAKQWQRPVDAKHATAVLRQCCQPPAAAASKIHTAQLLPSTITAARRKAGPTRPIRRLCEALLQHAVQVRSPVVQVDSAAVPVPHARIASSATQCRRLHRSGAPNQLRGP